MNLASVERWSSNLKNKMRRLNWSGATQQLNSGNVRIAHTLVALVPSFKRFLDQLTDDLRVWRMTGRINPGTMSVEAFEAAEAIGRTEYAIGQQMAAYAAAQAAAQAQAAANAQRQRAAREAANAESKARQAAAQAQHNRNAAAQRNAQRAKAAANAARRNAKAAENEARFAATEKARMNETRRKANNAAQNAVKAAHKATRQANLKARMNAARQRARQASRARQAGETPGVVPRPGAATRVNFNALRAISFATKNQFNAFLRTIKNGGGRSAFLKAKVKYAPMTSNNRWAVEKINRAWSRFYSS